MASKEDRPTYTTDFIKGDFDKAVYLDNPHTDNLMTAVMELSAEFWAVRRRQKVLETLIDREGVVSLAAIEAYQPTEEEKSQWGVERDDFIGRLYKLLTRPTGERPKGPMPSDTNHAPLDTY